MIKSFEVGDKVSVTDEGLKMLRKMMPDQGPNHHGIVQEVMNNGDILVAFPIGDDPMGEHSQVAPYPESQVNHISDKEWMAGTIHGE